jgi:hypothetical protein
MDNNQALNDPYDEAINAKARDFEVFGQVRVDAHYLFFPGNKQKPVVFDPAVHPQDKRALEVELRLIPIAEQNINWDEYQKMLAFPADWTKIVLPSIKAIGIDDLRALNNKWVRVAKVPGNRKRLDKNTQEETGEFWTTYKFMELYPSEDACKAAFGGHTPSDTEDKPVPQSNNETKAAALTFLKVFVSQAAKHLTDRAEIEKQVAADIANNSLISPLFTVQSPEVQAAINEALLKYAEIPF